MIAIGNGESRKGLFFLNNTVGCNAIFRDTVVDHLVCVDQRMVKEAIQTGYNKPIYTRKEWVHHFKSYPNVLLVPELPYQGTQRVDDPFQWGSGPYAVLLAATLDDHVELVGFDLFSHTGKVNNIYKDTANYLTSDKHAVDPSYWIHQISQVFKCFPDKYFTVYNIPNWTMPDSWCLKNVNFKTLDNLNKNM